ncbi:MAG: NrfD/PsrC family molybdoenzyme membrane anchor subunit [Acidimicrobiales bacterium]
MTTTAEPGTGPRTSHPWALPTWYALLAAGLLLGLFAFGYQWANGLTVTGLTNTVSWGLYIVLFMFLVGISAGGLIVVAGGELIGSHRLDALNRLAVIVSGTAIAAAAASIIPDLGRPELAWQMLVSPQPMSPLVWDMVVITVYLAIAVADLWILTRPHPARKALRMMAVVSLPVAVLVHSITAWIFGFLVARPFWNTAILAPLFISSALVSGTALVLVVAWIVRRVSSWEPPPHVFGDLAKLLAWFVAVDFFLLGAELITAYTSQTAYHLTPLQMLFTGRLAPLFWSQLGLGVLVPFVVYATPRLRARIPLLVGAAVLSILGVFAKRVDILMPAMYDPQVNLEPGIPAGRAGQGFMTDMLYVPTWVEYGVVIGILAFAGLLITVGVRRYVLPHDDAGATP